MREKLETDGNTPEAGEGFSLESLGLRSFLTAFIILALLMVGAYGLTFLLPSGEYARHLVDGRMEVIPGSWQPAEGGLPFWKWLASPVLSLGAEGGGLMAAVIVFLFVVGGTFNALEQSGLLSYMLQKLAHRYRQRRHILLFIIPLFFMSLGSFIGSFEECIPMVPIAISLALAMGWDVYMGLGISLLAVGCGFSTGILNPFTVGVAQSIAGLPMFSGLSFRLLAFVLVYALLMWFLTSHAKRLEKDPAFHTHGAAQPDFLPLPHMDRSLKAFVIIIGLGIGAILAAGFVPALSALILPITALMFLVAGIVCSLLAQMGGRGLGRALAMGAKSLAPAALLILMAASIRYTITEGHIMDTILHGAVEVISGKPRTLAILAIYLLVLLMEFVIASGSAKAFLLMPLIIPVVDMAGISRQLAVLAFAFGDGFSNVFYPTNPALLICLSVAGVSFGKWMRWTWKMQLGILAITSGLLLLGLAVGY